MKSENFQFVYFLETHRKEAKVKLYLKENDINNYYNSLKYEGGFELKGDDKNLYHLAIYSIKINFSNIRDKKKKELIKIVLEEEGKLNKYEAKINAKDIEENKDLFLFNLKFDTLKKSILTIEKGLTDTLNVPDSEVFNSYVNFLRIILII